MYLRAFSAADISVSAVGKEGSPPRDFTTSVKCFGIIDADKPDCRLSEMNFDSGVFSFKKTHRFLLPCASGAPAFSRRRCYEPLRLVKKIPWKIFNLLNVFDYMYSVNSFIV